MRRKIWSTSEATDTMRIQALREMDPKGLTGDRPRPADAGGEGGPSIDLLAAIREAGGEGGGSPG